MTAPTRRVELLRKRLDQFTRMLPGFDEGHVRALHRTRVASRRLREVLPVLQIQPSVVRRLSHRLRDVTRRLGVVRELDVLSSLVDELSESDRRDGRALRQLSLAIADERARERDRLREKLPTVKLRRVAAKLDRVADELEDRVDSRAWRWALDARGAHRALALKHAIQDAGALYLPDRLHAVRIALKKLRYALELSAEAAGVDRSAELRALKRAQDVLGRLHDRQVLIDRIRRFQAALNPPDSAIWSELDALTTDLENGCRRPHARFVRARADVLSICDRGVRSSPEMRRRIAAG